MITAVDVAAVEKTAAKKPQPKAQIRVAEQERRRLYGMPPWAADDDTPTAWQGVSWIELIGQR